MVPPVTFVTVIVARFPMFPVVQPNCTTVGAGTTITAGSTMFKVLESVQPLPDVTTMV